MKEDPLSSVRVEVESLGSADGSGPTAPSHEPTSSGGATPRLLLLAAGVLLVAVIAAIALLRPDDGQTAAGTDRGPTTTQASTTTEAATTIQTPTRAAPDGTANTNTGVELLSAEFELQAVVSDDQGYVALTWGAATGDGTGPGLLRSTDGLEWTAIDGITLDGTSVDAVDFVVNNEFGFGRFFGLARSDVGYSLFFESLDIEIGIQTTRRLVSNDAINWVVDVDFPVEAVHDSQANGKFSLLVTPDLFGEILVRDLLAGELIDPTQLPEGICYVSPTKEGEDLAVGVVSCGDGESVMFTAVDFVAPARMETVGACAEVLSFFSVAGSYAVYDSETNRSQTVSFPQKFVVFVSVFADGSIGALDVSHSVFTEDLFGRGDGAFDACRGLVDLTIPEADFVIHSTLDGQQRSTEVPEGLLDVDEDGGTGFTTTLGREFIVILGSEVWALDVDSSVWRQPQIDLPEVFDNDFVSFQHVDGQPGRLAWLGGSQVGVIDLNEETSIVEDRDGFPSFGQVVYADENYMFSQGSQTARIAMPMKN